jgi:hypothetical protein
MHIELYRDTFIISPWCCWMLLSPATKGTLRFSAFQICEFLDFVCPAGVRGKRASMPMWGACPSCSWKFLAFLSGKPWKTLGIYGIYVMACCDGKPWLWHGFGYDMCSPWLSTRLFQWYGCCLASFRWHSLQLKAPDALIRHDIWPISKAKHQ